MKIKYLKLKNFIGIFNGTGRLNIEIDFSKNKNKIILINGKNGTGKSCILSCLHPFATTMDERKEFILQDKNGEKVIVIENGDYTYKIHHHYIRSKNKMTTNSYISEKLTSDSDDKYVELNTNGKVNSFKEIVKEKLDVEESFFRLSRIGSNVTNFIDLKPAERKKYMSLLLSDVEEYLYYYKKVSEKYNKVNLLVKSIVEDINKLGNENDLNINKENYRKLISDKESNINKINSKISKTKGIILGLDSDGTLIDKFNDLSNEIDELNLSIDKEKIKLNQLLNKSDKLNESIDFDSKYNSLNEKLIKEKSHIDELKYKINNLRETLQKAISEKNKKEATYNKYSSKETLEELEEMLSKYTNLLDENKKEIDEKYPQFKKYSNSSEDYISELNDIVFNFESKRDKFINNQSFQSYNIDYIMNLLDENSKDEDIEKTYNSVFSIINSEKSMYDKGYKTIEQKINRLETNLSFMKENLKTAEILKKRPSNCYINDCPFIANATRFQNIDKDIENTEKSLSKEKVSLNKYDNKCKDYNELTLICNELNILVSFIIENRSRINKYPIKTFFNKRLFDIINISSIKIENIISSFTNYLNIYSDIILYEDRINEINSKIEIIKDKKDLIKSLKNDIDSLTNQISNLNNDIDNLSSDYEVSISRENKLNNTINLIKNIIDCKNNRDNLNNNLNQLNKEYNSMKNTAEKISLYEKEIDDDNLKLKNEEDELTPLKNELNKINIKLSKLEDYKSKQEELKEDYQNLGYLKESLSPTTGIPLLFIDIYLKKTRDICNNLLDLAYNGKMIITKFDITDSDFFIKMQKSNGEMLEDISIASQGERSLCSVAISLALIEQSLKKYNILLLDEIDATLDASNRRAFIDILERQLSILGIEQTFIISHNKEFDVYPLDLILLPGNTMDEENEDIMKNKNIIFKI